ncbi:MAG TPA: hypothetical protein VFH45_03675 [Acidimicrobiales bacterium]|nr:hypothetical protein [Acidimicrobiales bacterium]
MTPSDEAFPSGSDGMAVDGPRRRLPGRRVLIGGGIAVLVAGLGAGVAAAATSSSGGSGPSGSTAAPPALAPHGPGMRMAGPGRMGGMGLGMGNRGILHGQFVRSNGSGGYQTVDVQTGQVTDVSTGSITVKSADGYTRQYAVTTNTLVDAGRDGIGSVHSGDTVALAAVESGGTATAQSINDRTNMSNIRKYWGYGPSGQPAPPPGQQSGQLGQ